MSTAILRYFDPADQDVQRRVVNYLAARHAPAFRQIHVTVRRGVTTLRGQVQTFYEKQLALHAARRVAGVSQVVDAVRVAATRSGAKFSAPRPATAGTPLRPHLGDGSCAQPVLRESHLSPGAPT